MTENYGVFGGEPRAIVPDASGAKFAIFFARENLRNAIEENATLPMPKHSRRILEILSPEEVARLIDASSNLFHRTMLMTLYSTGIRRAELCRLQVSDIDNGRTVIHVHKGKGGHDCDVPLSEKLLAALRV